MDQIERRIFSIALSICSLLLAGNLFWMTDFKNTVNERLKSIEDKLGQARSDIAVIQAMQDTQIMRRK